MPSFYFAGWLVFSLIKTASLALHFLGNTPYGVPVVEAPVRFLPNAAIFMGRDLFSGTIERTFLTARFDAAAAVRGDALRQYGELPGNNRVMPPDPESGSRP